MVGSAMKENCASTVIQINGAVMALFILINVSLLDCEKKMERYERREKKLDSKKNKMKKHGKNLATIYKNALDKRIT